LGAALLALRRLGKLQKPIEEARVA